MPGWAVDVDGATGQVHRYYYDALGRRVGKAVDVNGLNQVAYYLYDGEQIIEERDAAGVVKASYVNGRYVDEVLSMTRTQTYYFHQDDQYNTLRATLNTTRGEWYEYGSFGEPTFLGNTQSRIPATLIGNNRLWNGREYDAETGLYYYRTRYLDPRAGRFTTRDTIGIWGDPMNLGNGYAYVGNNPWTYVDPHGLAGMLAAPRGGGMNREFQGMTRAPYQYRQTEYWLEQRLALEREHAEAEARLRLLNFGADWSTSLTPFVNDGRDLVGAWRGYDEFSQEELTTVDRTLYGASVIIGSGAALKKAKDRGLKSACRLWEWLKRKLGKNRHFIDDMTPGEARRYRDYWERAEGYPMQGAPYQMKTWHHPDGTIKTVQTYDEKGHFHRQYGVTERNHAPHQHNAKKRNTKNGNAPERDPVHRPIDE